MGKRRNFPWSYLMQVLPEEVHTMENSGHVANKIRVFIETMFRHSSEVNPSFWSSDTPIQQRHNTLEVSLRFAHSTRSISNKYNWNFFVIYIILVFMFLAIVHSQVVLHCLLYKLMYPNRHNCNIPNIRLDETLGMQLYSMFLFSKWSKTSVYC